jgi:sugar (pentulose or hexulose) kinase
MQYLALDLGTSFLKGAVLDLDAPAVRHGVRVPFPAAVSGLPPRHVQVEPQAILAALNDLLAQLHRHAPDAAGVMVTSQMHGLILLDEQGRPHSNAVTWQDQCILDARPGASDSRGGTLYDELLARVTPAQIAATGNGIKPSLPLCTLAWRAAQGLDDSGLIPASLADAALSMLSGNPPVSEPTMGASMGMLDLATRAWHTEMVAAAGATGLVWPRVVDIREPVYDLPVGGRRLPCYAPVGDHQCAVVGAFLQPGELSLNISTGSQVGSLTPSFVPGPYETRPYFDGNYLQAVVRIPAGRALSALVELLTELARAEGITLRDPWATIAAAVAATPTTTVDANISYFAGAVGDEGHFSHLTEVNMTVGHLFRAAFQNMARNYAACAGMLTPPQPWARLVFSGGLAQRFGPLRDEIVAQFGLPYRMCPTSEDTLLGLLALARVAAGRAVDVAASVDDLRHHDWSAL